MVGLLLSGACTPEAQQHVRGVEGLDGGGLDGSGGDPAEQEPLAYAVVSSDRTVSSITLLAPDGAVLAADFINSGSASTGLVTALSGDVVLPTRSGDPDMLTLIDRFRTDVVTRVDPSRGEILGQVKTHRPNDDDDDTGYSSNPQDYVFFGEHDAWVTRFEPKASAPVDDPDRGADLLHIDPTDFERGERISLRHLDHEAERDNLDTMETETVTVYARPSGMVRLGELLVVGIASLSLTYDTAGDGMVALVDPAAGSAEGFALPGLQNCGGVLPIPSEASRVVVVCEGFFRGVQRDTAGLAILRLQGGSLSVEHTWHAKDDEQAPLTVAAVTPLGASEVAATAVGAPAKDDGSAITQATNDVMYVVDIATGEQTELFEAEGRYVIGSGVYNARRRLLLVPDASSDGDGRPTAGVRTFEREDDGSFEAVDVIEAHDILPPRQVRPL